MVRQYKLGLSSTTNLLLFLPLTLKNPNQLNQHSLYLVFTKGRENISQAVLSVTQSHLHIKLIWISCLGKFTTSSWKCLCCRMWRPAGSCCNVLPLSTWRWDSWRRTSPACEGPVTTWARRSPTSRLAKVIICFLHSLENLLIAYSN